MRCPFDYHRRDYTFGVAQGFVEFSEEQDDKAEAALNEKYPTCWDKFLHWLGIKSSKRPSHFLHVIRNSDGSGRAAVVVLVVAALVWAVLRG